MGPGDPELLALKTLRVLRGAPVIGVPQSETSQERYALNIARSFFSGHPHISVEIIPGVSSVMAAAARAEVPLVTHGQRLAILPEVYGIDDLQEAFAHYDAVVLMKVDPPLLQGLANLEKLGLVGGATYI